MQLKGWDEFEIGSVLSSFEEKVDNIPNIHQEDRKYSENNSYQASVSHWRVDKPVFNDEHCINCFFCWIYCPDTSILARDEKMVGIDYIHCKGCGICSNVCPTDPKSLIMFDTHTDEKEVLASWPQKAKKDK